jgi:hypothetical protein
MTITVDVRPEVQAELARQAAARGSRIEAYVANLLEQATHLPATLDKDRAQTAADRIRGLREGITLGGLTIRELIDEGRR